MRHLISLGSEDAALQMQQGSSIATSPFLPGFCGAIQRAKRPIFTNTLPFRRDFLVVETEALKVF